MIKPRVLLEETDAWTRSVYDVIWTPLTPFAVIGEGKAESMKTERRPPPLTDRVVMTPSCRG